jgi:hypothetical protein
MFIILVQMFTVWFRCSRFCIKCSIIWFRCPRFPPNVHNFGSDVREIGLHVQDVSIGEAEEGGQGDEEGADEGGGWCGGELSVTELALATRGALLKHRAGEGFSDHG